MHAVGQHRSAHSDTAVGAMGDCGGPQVQRDFEELPADAADGLRTSLVTLLLRFSRGAPPVRTQLCLALAAIPPHMPGGSWGDGGVIPWLAQRLGQVYPEPPPSLLRVSPFPLGRALAMWARVLG